MQYEFIRRSTHNFTGINDHMMVTQDNKVHVTNMELSWVLSAPGGPHVGRMNLAIRDVLNIRFKQPNQQLSCYDLIKRRHVVCNMVQWQW